MKWFANLKTRYKLFIGFGVVIAVLLTLIGVENLQSTKSLVAYESIFTTQVPLNQGGSELVNELMRERMLFGGVLSTFDLRKDEAALAEARTLFSEQLQSVESALQLTKGLFERTKENLTADGMLNALDNAHQQFLKISRNHKEFAE